MHVKVYDKCTEAEWTIWFTRAICWFVDHFWKNVNAFTQIESTKIQIHIYMAYKVSIAVFSKIICQPCDLGFAKKKTLPIRERKKNQSKSYYPETWHSPWKHEGFCDYFPFEMIPFQLKWLVFKGVYWGYPPPTSSEIITAVHFYEWPRLINLHKLHC